MDFIETREHVLIPVHQIETIGAPRRDKDDVNRVCDVHTLSGKTYTISEDWIVEHLMTTVVPASPGFELLVAAGADDEEFWCDRAPIVAWRIYTGYGLPMPVTAGGDEELSGPRTILLPNGRVEVQEGGSHESFEVWERLAREVHAEARAAKKAERAKA
jgi:hypothetical protein